MTGSSGTAARPDWSDSLLLCFSRGGEEGSVVGVNLSVKADKRGPEQAATGLMSPND